MISKFGNDTPLTRVDTILHEILSQGGVGKTSITANQNAIDELSVKLGISSELGKTWNRWSTVIRFMWIMGSLPTLLSSYEPNLCRVVIISEVEPEESVALY